MIPILIHFQIINSYFLPLTIFIIPSFFIFYLMLKQQQSEALENVKGWTLMYVTYLFYAIAFTLLIILGELGLLDFIVAI